VSVWQHSYEKNSKFVYLPNFLKFMKHFLLGLALIFVSFCVAQDNVVTALKRESDRAIKKEADTSQWIWKRGGLMSFNMAQGSLSNWAAGGDNFSLTINGYFNYYFFYREGRRSWDNNLDVNLGYVQTTSLGGRKNDDRVDYLSKYGYKMDSTGKWYISGLFNFRSQFFDGFTFSNNVPNFVSTFLSPAYIVLSAGFDYKPDSKLSVFLSPLTSRWVIVANDSLSRKGLYGVPVGKKSINEIGAYATVNYNNTIAKNITYKGRLDLFSNYNNKPQNIDIFMTNIFSFKINKYFSATYNLDIIYDDDVRIFGDNKDAPGLQAKSLIGIGFLKPISPVRKVKVGSGL
jgi:hypothetical protein